MTDIATIMQTSAVIPVLVIEDATTARPLAEALVAGGLKVLEVTLRTGAAMEAIAEMKKVTWPDRAQLQQATIQIIVFVLVLGAIIALIDVLLQALLVRLPAMLAGR